MKPSKIKTLSNKLDNLNNNFKVYSTDEVTAKIGTILELAYQVDPILELAKVCFKNGIRSNDCNYLFYNITNIIPEPYRLRFYNYMRDLELGAKVNKE